MTKCVVYWLRSVAFGACADFYMFACVWYGNDLHILNSNHDLTGLLRKGEAHSIAMNSHVIKMWKSISFLAEECDSPCFSCYENRWIIIPWPTSPCHASSAQSVRSRSQYWGEQSINKAEVGILFKCPLSCLFLLAENFLPCGGVVLCLPAGSF